MANSTAENSATENSTTEKPMIAAEKLSKFYGPFVAVRDISFSVPQGEVAAFLGPNGAGKSTTMKLLTGFLAPSEGRAEIGGFDVTTRREEASRLIGYLPENGPLYNEMTPKSLLKYMGSAHGMSSSDLNTRMEYVAEKCRLKSVWSKSISKLSRGFRQRVGMAHALLHDPHVLILDEPTSGLDPNQVHDVRELIHTLAKTKTILLSTHILTEVKAVCSRVLVVDQGRLIFDGPVSEMKGTTEEMEEKFHQMTTTV